MEVDTEREHSGLLKNGIGITMGRNSEMTEKCCVFANKLFFGDPSPKEDFHVDERVWMIQLGQCDI